MHRSFLFILFVVTSFRLTAQKVIISGKEGNRPLLWTDFKGKPDESNPFFALTYWKVGFRTDNITASGENLIIGLLEVTLELDPNESWVKENRKTDELLEHEQGHFNIGLLCMRELLKKEKEAVFTKSNINTKLQSIFSDVLKKYKDMDDQYDRETDHSKNKQEQKKWNDFFKEQNI